MTERVKILNAEIDNIHSTNLLHEIKKEGVSLTPNVDHLMKLQKDLHFQKIYDQADFVVCDSKIIYCAAKLLGQKIKEKILDSDFFSLFYKYYQNKPNIKIFLLGGTEKYVELAKANINKKLSNSIIAKIYFAPIVFKKNELENQKVIDLINNSSATILVTRVGTPKQEKWIYQYKNKLLNVKIFLVIGAMINFEARVEKRSLEWISNASIEWLHRMIHNYQRLWKRYFIESLPFF